jgi:alginate O-acetyltransferase complex protein AlgI
MFLGGLWHGAAWTFVIWGLLHGLFLVIHNVARDHGLTPPSVVVNRVITFACVVAAFVVFRAPDMGVAGDVLRSMAGLHGLGSPATIRHGVGFTFAAMIAAALVWVNFVPNTWQVEIRPRPLYGLALGLAMAAAILQIAAPSPFLYFQF